MKYKPTKQALNQFEVAFFRLFPPLSIVGAAELGDPTFLINYGFYFLLILPVMDVIQCIMYWNKDTTSDPLFKRNYNRFHYTLKALANVVGSTMILLASTFGFEDLLVPGQAVFVGGVVGLTAFQYLIKTFGGLEDQDSATKEYRTAKNGILSTKMLTVTTGLALLYFFGKQQAFQEPLGWSLLIAANVFHVVGFNVYDRFKDKSTLIDTALLLGGMGITFVKPALSTGLDAQFHTEVGVGIAMLLTGFALSIGRAIHKWKVDKKKVDDGRIQPAAAQPSSPRPLAEEENAQPKQSSLVRFCLACLPCSTTPPTSPSLRK